MTLSYDDIMTAAAEVGFDLCGVTTAEPMPEEKARFEQWLAGGNQGNLGYMERNCDKRFAPALLVDGAESVIVCGLAYGVPDEAEGCTDGKRAKIAPYACREDYHSVFRRLLPQLAERLGLNEKGIRWRAFTDSAPLAEKALAMRAGLGGIGRNSLLITEQFGSRVLLGELVVCAPTDRYSEPLAQNPCSGCGLCVERCPASAILPEGGIDTRKCIACRTVEPAAALGEDGTAGWLFGCDECQACCPCNEAAERRDNPLIATLFNSSDFSTEWWTEISDEEFVERFGTTPMSRAGAERMREGAKRL